MWPDWCLPYRQIVWYEPKDWDALPQQETQAMSVTVGETLDGMTVEQLRDLAKRAEAAAKKQEEAKENKAYVEIGVIGAWEWRVKKSSGEIGFRVKGATPWRVETGYTDLIGALLPKAAPDSLIHLAEIMKRVADKKSAGVFK